MKIPKREITSRHRDVLHGLKEGFSYAFSFAPIKYILLLLGLVSLMAVPYQILMPVFAKDIFHGGPQTLGFLTAMSGIGALAGAIYLASRSSVVGLGQNNCLGFLHLRAWNNYFFAVANPVAFDDANVCNGFFDDGSGGGKQYDSADRC